jgi:hypothetical protein
MRPAQSINRRSMAPHLPGAHVFAHLKPTPSDLCRITLLLSVAPLVALSLRQLAMLAAVALVTVFSAERAMRDLQVIAREPRAVGSPGHAAARQYRACTSSSSAQ